MKSSCSLCFHLVSFAKLDSGTVTKCNFAGDENTGASWTEKIMANKSNQENTGKSAAQGEGVDDDEWVCFSVQLNMFWFDHIKHSFKTWVDHEQMCNLCTTSCYEIKQIQRFNGGFVGASCKLWHLFYVVLSCFQDDWTRPLSFQDCITVPYLCIYTTQSGFLY